MSNRSDFYQKDLNRKETLPRRIYRLEFAIYILIFLSVVAVVAVRFVNSERYHKSGGPYYFKDFSYDYGDIKWPTGEITFEAAKKRGAYFVAYFSDEGKILSIEKIIAGQSQFKEVYIYDSEGELLSNRGVGDN